MKHLTLTVSLLFFTCHSFALIIVTDLDDTLKITNVLDRSEATRNALFSKKAFLQFPNLLNEMNKYAHGLYILSGSPTLLKRKVSEFLNFHNISRNDVILRNIMTERNSFQYKLNNLKQLFEERSDESFILIGDDTEKDAGVYTKIRELYPTQVLQIYIRSIKNKKQPLFIKRFYTAFDIAMYEFEEDRLGLNEVLLMGNSFLFIKKMDLVFPDFSYCPKETAEYPSSSSMALVLLNKQIKNRLAKYCQKS